MTRAQGLIDKSKNIQGILRYRKGIATIDCIIFQKVTKHCLIRTTAKLLVKATASRWQEAAMVYHTWYIYYIDLIVLKFTLREMAPRSRGKLQPKIYHNAHFKADLWVP